MDILDRILTWSNIRLFLLIIQNKFYKDAFSVCKQALFKKSQKGAPELIYNLKIWSLYLDMELNLGTQ